MTCHFTPQRQDENGSFRALARPNFSDVIAAQQEATEVEQGSETFAGQVADGFGHAGGIEPGVVKHLRCA
uniref:hypothetical protein n=1 Tax=Streptomyces sp. CA-141956 TaxID=3240051 RepID=UPI003F4929A0